MLTLDMQRAEQTLQRSRGLIYARTGRPMREKTVRNLDRCIASPSHKRPASTTYAIDVSLSLNDTHACIEILVLGVMM